MSAREAKLRITGDNRSAIAALKGMDRGVVNSAKGIRSLAAGLRTVGTLTGGYLAYDVITRQLEFGDAITRSSAILGLQGESADEFRTKMESLKTTWVSMGREAGELGAAIFDNAIAIRALRGDGSATEKMMRIFERAMLLTETGATDLGTAVKAVVTTLRAYKLDASQAENVSNSLTSAYLAATGPIGEVADRLAALAPRANAVGASFDEVLEAMIGLGPEYDEMIQYGIALKGVMQEGGEKAAALRTQLDITLAPGQDPTVAMLFDAVNQAMANGVNIAPTLASAIDATITADDVARAKSLADEYGRVFDARQKLKLGGDTLNDLASASRSDDSLLGRIMDANRRNNELPELERMMNGLFGRSEASAGLTWLVDNIGESLHNVRQGEALSDWRIVPRTPSGTLAPVNGQTAPGFRLVNPDGSPVAPGSLMAPAQGPIHIGTLNLNGSAVKDGESFKRQLSRELERDGLRTGSGRR